MTGRLHKSWDAAWVGLDATPVVPFVSVMQVRSLCDARFNPGGHETASYLCLNERSGLMRPGKMRRLPGGDLLNSPRGPPGIPSRREEMVACPHTGHHVRLCGGRAGGGATS